MPSPFPGMDPYLEHPAIWPGVRHEMIVALRDALLPLVRPRYYIATEVRVRDIGPAEFALAGIPDAALIASPNDPRGRRGPSSRENGPRPYGAVHTDADADEVGQARVLMVELPKTMPLREAYLEVRETDSRKAITVIELLSPTNKASGEGRAQYERKRMAIAATLTNFVEIDLLRFGEPMPVRYLAMGPDVGVGDYRMLVSRGHWEHRAELYPVSIRESLPRIRVPLRPEEDEPTLDLQSILNAVYGGGAYELRLDYRQEPVPPLGPDDAGWADALLSAAGVR